MKKNNFLSIIFLLLLSGLLSWNFYFREYVQRDTVNIHLFPAKIGEWTAKEIPISDYDYSILETRNAFSRLYKDPSGREIQLFIVYSQSNRKVSHPPEICYTGSGATITKKTPVTLDLGPDYGPVTINRVNVDFGREREEVEVMYYVFKIGDSFTANYWQQQILIAFKTLLGKPSSSALIRISVYTSPQNMSNTDTTAQEFLRLIYQPLQQYLP